MCKISKNVEFLNPMFTVCYSKLRKLGNSEVLSIKMPLRRSEGDSIGGILLVVDREGTV